MELLVVFCTIPSRDLQLFQLFASYAPNSLTLYVLLIPRVKTSVRYSRGRITRQSRRFTSLCDLIRCYVQYASS